MEHQNLKQTPFTHFHKKDGAKMVGFAGYEMPISFEGVLAEHNYVRENGVGLFDVSHMGQITFKGSFVSKELSKILPCDIEKIQVGHCKYSVLLNENGGIIDDLILSKNDDGSVSVVVNGSRKYVVLEWLKIQLPQTIEIIHHENKALLALQGSNAVKVLMAHNFEIANLKFMQFQKFMLDGYEVTISRSGYTGEDGFEISIDSKNADGLYKLLLKDDIVKSIGLGARDSLRLEAGLCLYGQDLDEEISPIEADLSWCISKPMTAEKNYIGSNVIAEQLENGVSRIRVGLLPEGKAPIRQGVEIFNESNEKIGAVTSGGFSPTLNAPIAMGYVDVNYKEIGTVVYAFLRGKYLPMKIAKLPFVVHNYVRAL